MCDWYDKKKPHSDKQAGLCWESMPGQAQHKKNLPQPPIPLPHRGGGLGILSIGGRKRTMLFFEMFAANPSNSDQTETDQ